MPERPYLSLILPAYNERQSIQKTIEEAFEYFRSRKLSVEVIVAADGNDGTRELVAEMAKTLPQLTVIGSVERKGKGHGIRQAVALARGRYIGFADADNKTPISDFDSIRPYLENGEPFVTGSRGLGSSEILQRQKRYRQIGSKLFGFVVRFLVGLHDVPDTQCGFKFFQRHVAKQLFAVQIVDGYMFDVEILVLAKRLGYAIRSVPIHWRDDADSRLNLVLGNLQNAWDVLTISARCAWSADDRIRRLQVHFDDDCKEDAAPECRKAA